MIINVPIQDFRTTRQAITQLEQFITGLDAENDQSLTALSQVVSDLTQTVANQKVRLGVTTTTITAYASPVFGQGQVQLYNSDELSLSADVVTVFSTFGSTIAAGRFVYVVYTAGAYFVLVDGGVV